MLIFFCCCCFLLYYNAINVIYVHNVLVMDMDLIVDMLYGGLPYSTHLQPLFKSFCNHMCPCLIASVNILCVFFLCDKTN